MSLWRRARRLLTCRPTQYALAWRAVQLSEAAGRTGVPAVELERWPAERVWLVLAHAAGFDALHAPTVGLRTRAAADLQRYAERCARAIPGETFRAELARRSPAGPVGRCGR